MELHNLEDRLVQLKEYGKLNYEWEQPYAGSLVIKNPKEDLDALIGLLRKDINNEEFFGKFSFNRFNPPEFNEIKFIIIHKANIKSTKEYMDFKDKFQHKIKNQDLINKAEDWITQFPFFDWKIYALKLLSNIIYLDEDDIEKKLIEIKKYMGALDDFVISDIEGIPKSSTHLFYPLNKILEISSKKFISSKDLEPSDDRDIVFIDDMIGTGNQAINYIQKLKGDDKIGSQKLYYYAIVGLKGGVKELKDSGLFKNVSATIELPKRTFESGYIFTVEDSGTARDMASFIGEQLTKNMKNIDPLGYENSEALVFFRHNTPNNSLPIFWASGMCRILGKVGEPTEVRWNPLFPRKEKPKSEPKLTGEHVDANTQTTIESVSLKTSIPIIQPPVVKTSVPTSDHGWTNKTVAASFVEKKMELKIFDTFIMREMPENTICIHGFGGTGKSTLLRRFAVRAKEEKIQVIYGSMRGQNLSSFILTYASCIELKSEYASSSDFIFLDHFLKVVDKPTVVFIDDYPETSEKDELTNWLIDEAQRRDSTVLFVLASRSKPNFQSTSPASYMEISGMSPDETKEFIMRSEHLRSNWIKETVEYLDNIYSITSGNPKVIELLCTDQRAWDYFKKHPDMQLHTIREVNLLYGQIWRNLETTTKDAVKLLATCVHVSPYIHKGLIRDLIPNWEFEMNNLLTRSLLAEVGNDLFSLHDTFKDFIYQDRLGMIERSKYHQQLASYYYLNDRLKNRNMYSLIHYVEARNLKDVIRVYSEGTKTMESVSNINVVRDLEERILSLIKAKASGDEIQNIKDFECRVLINLAEHNRVLSDYQAAISNFEKALRLANTCNFHKSIVVCNSGMGDVYRRMGEYELALKHYWNARDMCQSDDTYERARVYTGLGAASKMLCKYRDALEFHKKAKSLYNEIDDKKGICRNLRGHAASLNIIGDYGGALREYTAAKEIYETEVSDERGRAYALWGCGESSRMMGKYPDALSYFEEAIDIARAIGDSWAEIYLNLNMGELYRSNRELTDAKIKFDAAIELATKKQSHVECAYGKLGLAETKRLEGLFDYKIYDEVLITFKEHDSCWGIVHGHIGKALAYLSQGDQNFYKIIIDQARKVCQQKNMEREIQILKAIESESGRDYLHPMNFP